MGYIPVYGERGRMLFRFDPQRAIIQIRQRGVEYRVDLYTVTRERSGQNAVQMLPARQTGAESTAEPEPPPTAE